MTLSTRLGLVAAFSGIAAVSSAQLFSDPCESLTAYTVTQFDADNVGVVVDYSNFVIGATTINIPEAPRPISGGGATTGILLQTNIALPTGTTGINMILNSGGVPLEVTSSDYMLSLDLYMKCDNPVGGIGTTQAFNAGVSRVGDVAAIGWYNRATAGDGNWVTFVGDGGINGTDMRNYRGTAQQGGLDVGSVTCQSVFSFANGYEYAGAPGGNWTKVDLAVIGGRMYWRMNGTAFPTTVATATNGKVWFGYDDPFAGVAGAIDKQYAIVDNVVVKELPKFTGNLTLSGYGGDITTENFTALVLDGAGAVIDTLTFKVDLSGNFSFGTTMEGAGSVVITADSSVNRWIQNVTPTVGGTSLGNVNLLNGNVAPDNFIDILDYTILAAKFSASSADPDWNTVGVDGYRPSQADVTGDGIVDIADYTQLSANFSAVSEYIP